MGLSDGLDVVVWLLSHVPLFAKKCKKAKCLSAEVLQIAEKRRDAKGKGEKEIYTHLNPLATRMET